MSCDPAFNAFDSKGPQYNRSRSRGFERASHGRGRHSCFSKRRLSTGRASELHIHPYPIQTLDEIKARYSDLLSTAKLQWLDNPKNVIFSYKHSRFGSYPESVTLEGRYSGGNKPVFRSTIAIDDDLGIVATGDGTSRKEAEKAAALHGMILLLEKDYILHPPPRASNSITKVNAKVPVAALSDGTEVTLEQAREFIDYFCHEGRFGSPDVKVDAVYNTKSYRAQLYGWKAVISISGTPVGESIESSKKAAQNTACLNTATILANEYRDVWDQYLQVPKSKLAGKAPPVKFRVSSAFEEKIRHLYDAMRDSELYSNRPRITAAFSLRSSVAAPKRNSIQAQRTMSEEQHEEKSNQMLENLNAYQLDERVEPMRLFRQALPVSQHAGDILVKIERNPVTICMASTGSGKTTQVPQLLLDDFILRKQGSRCNIICTQPRRIAAISVAERIAKERGEALGDTVGYQVRFQSHLPKPHGSILFCTTGVLLMRLQTALKDISGNSFLDNVSHILMDEVHERDIETDLFLAVIRRVLQERKKRGCPEIKLVLMSATVDPKLFKDYFEESSLTTRPVPVVNIPGRSFPVRKFYLEDIVSRLRRIPERQGGWIWREHSVQQYVHREIVEKGGTMGGSENDAVDNIDMPYPLVALVIADVISRSTDGHVLVFLPGWEEIKAVHQLLLSSKQMPMKGLDFDDQSKFEIHLLHSSVPVSDQQAVFEPLRDPMIRRIILSTNIAETSVTIPDVVYVVDTGRVKEKRFDPEHHLSSLVMTWVGRSNLNQRAGRAGRHRPGEYYGLLSETHHDRLGMHQTVEMKRMDLSNVVMHIKALHLPGMEVEDVLASTIEPPAPERVKPALENLERIGALDYHSNLTALGQVLLQLPVDVYIGKMCLFGALFRCLDPALSLAAILTNRDPFVSPVYQRQEARVIKNSWCSTSFRSDPLCILNAYEEWSKLQRIDPNRANRFTYKNMLSRTTLFQIQQVKENLFTSLVKANVIQVIKNSRTFMPRYRKRVRETDPEFNVNAHSTSLLSALIAVSSPHFAVRISQNVYRTAQDKSCFIHASSVCSAKFQPDKSKLPFVDRDIYAFSEKVHSAGQSTTLGGATTFMRTCTHIDPLSYMLFGASEVQASSNGLECDAWLPLTGDYDALDGVERIKAVMDACLLRVLEGIRCSHARAPSSKLYESHALSDHDDDPDSATHPIRPLSVNEERELETFTAGIVDMLDHYKMECYGSPM